MSAFYGMGEEDDFQPIPGNQNWNNLHDHYVAMQNAGSFGALRAFPWQFYAIGGAALFLIILARR